MPHFKTKLALLYEDAYILYVYCKFKNEIYIYLYLHYKCFNYQITKLLKFAYTLWNREKNRKECQILLFFGFNSFLIIIIVVVAAAFYMYW